MFGNINNTLTVSWNTSAITGIDNKLLQAFEQSVGALKTDVIQEEVVPFNSGQLQNDISLNLSHEQEGEILLTTSLDYGLRMYFHPEYNFQKINNSKARGEWYEMWIRGSKKYFLQDTFKTFYKGGTP